MTYLPFAEISISNLTVFAIGLTVGIIEGIFGPLANLFMVPALSIFGLPPSIAASANAGQSFGRSSIFIFGGGKDHLALYRAGTVAGIAGLPGVLLGFKLHLLLLGSGWGKGVFLLLYAALLSGSAAVLYRHWAFFNRHHYYEDAPFPSFGLNWRFPLAVPGGSGVAHLTPARVILTGLLLGFGSGLLGLVAGIAGIPLFMYLLGLPLKNALATDNVAMLVIGAGTILCYAAAGRLELAVVLLLLAAAALGSRIGTLFPGDLSLGHARLALALLLGVTAAAVSIALISPAYSRVIISVAGLALCASTALYAVIPENFWAGRISRLIRGAK